MASSFISIPASFDDSRLLTTTNRPVRMEQQKDGRRVGFIVKRVGAHQPKKKRNRK